jgi:hypothetical protein
VDAESPCRIDSANVADEYTRQIYLSEFSSGWLAQAHHIFDSLAITSDLDDYGEFHFQVKKLRSQINFSVLVNLIQYSLRLLSPVDDLPPGYLFLCPLTNLQTEVPACLRTPACAAYWALDSEGTTRLIPAEARALGFPNIELSLKFWKGVGQQCLRRSSPVPGRPRPSILTAWAPL